MPAYYSAVAIAVLPFQYCLFLMQIHFQIAPTIFPIICVSNSK